MADLRKILIAEDIEGGGIDRLRAKYEVVFSPQLWKNPGEAEREIENSSALLVRNQTSVTESLILRAKRLMVIGRAGAGYDNIDVNAASRAGIVVCFSPEENAVSVAEHVFALLLALARKIPGANESVKAGKWERKKYHGVELLGKTIGILGFGKIGFRVALRAKAFGMRIVAHDPYLSPAHLHVTESGATLVSLETLLSESDVLTIHLPLTQDTRGLFNETLMRKMKSSALLVNTSRGEILSEKDLVKVLREGGIAGAALDVQEKEPPPPGTPLSDLENVILTPHTAGLTFEAQEKVVEAISEDVDRVLEGLPAFRYVNFPLPRK